MKRAAVLLLLCTGAHGLFETHLRGAQYMLELYNKELAAQGRRPLLGAASGLDPNITERDVRIPMRDGASLYTSVFFPPGWTGKGACVYQQVPYNMEFHNTAIIPVWEILLQFNVSVILVLQETRGRYNSTGVFNFFRDSEQDAQDTFDYLIKQDWSNGVVIPWGVSAMGIKVFLTSEANYTIRAQAMSIASNSFRSPTLFRNGQLNTGIISVIAPFLNISIPSLSPALKAHEGPSDWWTPTEFSDWGHVYWPTSQGTGWYDLFQQAHIDAFEGTRASSGLTVRYLHRLVIDPLGHCGLRNNAFPDFNQTAINVTAGLGVMGPAILFGIFKDADGTISNGIALAKYAFVANKIPRYIFYVLGSGLSLGAGHYVTGVDDWPDFTDTVLYLTPGGQLAAGAAPQGGNKSYDYDPSNPVPTMGGNQFQGGMIPCGPLDQLKIGPRKDILSFTGLPFTAKVAITGRVKLQLQVSSTANDTDFVAKLVDVFPNGTRLLIADGIQTMRWKDGGEQAKLITPGKLYSIEVDLWSTSWIFATGHAVGVDVTSSNSPAFRPNPNTGLPLAQVEHLWPMPGQPNVTATNTIHFGPNTALHIPVVKESDLPYLPPINPVSLFA